MNLTIPYDLGNTVIWSMLDDSIPRLKQGPSCPYWAAGLKTGIPLWKCFGLAVSYNKEMASPTPNLALPQLRIYILEASWRRVSHHVGPRQYRVQVR